MTRKSHGTANTKRQRARERTPILVWILVVLAVGTFGALIQIAIKQDRVTSLDRELAQVVVPEELTRWEERWPLLPSVEAATLAGPIDAVRAAYAFAARRTDVLQHIPCYCGCERMGHRSNAQCYLKGGVGGEHPQWDTHAYHCSICLDVTRQVMQLYAAGRNLSEIRDAIDARYVSIYGAGTPTPRPSSN